tara:strand:+ start:117 stop:527 length:411 start_codon:yes stop_codon:yes gene_type:complete
MQVRMKKLLAIVVLGLMWSGNVFANSLVGTQLQCGSKTEYMLGAVQYFRFINNKEVKSFWIHNQTLKVREFIYDYKEYPTKIELLWGNTIVSHTINRKTLRKKDGTRCKVIKFNIRNKLDKEAQQLLNAVQKDNKI